MNTEAGPTTTPVPTGVVTFAFTDIEGSTARWERNRPAMQDAVRKHDTIMRAAIEEHGGRVFKTIGDAFCCAFTRADSALIAMSAAQQRLAAEDFAAVEGLRVRVALHTGLADERDNDYFGPTLNRVARLLAIGHGGQILVSAATRELTHNHLPAGSSLVDLGVHQLRDLIETERVWQFNVVGVPEKFPPLRSVGGLPNNLPVQRASFVGRESDVAGVKGLLEQHRLLTLLGSGGVGKTRLAVQVGAEFLDSYRDGVWFVDLAPIGDPELVASVVAQALGMSQDQSRKVEDAIPQWLKPKQLLLILDNCEHLVDTAALLANAILAAAPEVKILATSRQGLNISGETHYRLSSLAVPDDGIGLRANDALCYGAIALFVDRARGFDARFTLTDDAVAVVAEICRRLDGIALAIELAAARVRMLSLANLAKRLDERFKILTSGGRDVLPRQKTLMALIDWSYDLLTPSEQRLFARLGVFAGGFGLNAVTSVCGDDSDDIETFDTLASLADKSLIVADTAGESERYRLLESTSAYALEKLNSTRDRDRFARRHAEFFCKVAEAGERSELENYRAALEWTLTQGHDAILGGSLASVLELAWHDAGVLGEGRYWIELALTRVDETAQPQIAGRLHLIRSHMSDGKRRYESADRALQLLELCGDQQGKARARRSLGFALFQMGRLDEAREETLQALAAMREHDVLEYEPNCLDNLAVIELNRGDLAAARELFAQALARFRANGDHLGTSPVLSSMADLEFAAGDFVEAARLADEALAIASGGKHLPFISGLHINAAAYRIALGNVNAAREVAGMGLRMARQAHNELLGAVALQHIGLLAALDANPQGGARLLGYSDAFYARLELKREHTEQWSHDKLLSALREALDENAIAALTTEGAAWSEDRAVEEALNTFNR